MRKHLRRRKRRRRRGKSKKSASRRIKPPSQWRVQEVKYCFHTIHLTKCMYVYVWVYTCSSDRFDDSWTTQRKPMQPGRVSSDQMLSQCTMLSVMCNYISYSSDGDSYNKINCLEERVCGTQENSVTSTEKQWLRLDTNVNATIYCIFFYRLCRWQWK